MTRWKTERQNDVVVRMDREKVEYLGSVWVNLESVQGLYFLLFLHKRRWRAVIPDSCRIVLLVACWWLVGGLLVACWWLVGGVLVACWWRVGGVLVVQGLLSAGYPC